MGCTSHLYPSQSKKIEKVSSPSSNTKNNMNMNIGSHIRKSKKFLDSLEKWYDCDRFTHAHPCQMFTGSPKFWRRCKKNITDIEATKKFVTDRGIKVFIHSIYLINLSRSAEEFQEKAFDCLKWELEFGSEIGFKGVVVHCGKFLKLNLDEALTNMYDNMRSLLPYISVECPLLLETSAGQGTEVCYKYADLRKFYRRFTEDEKKKIRICIDTCHVFAAGNDPLQFIDDWIKDEPGTLALVHFNDSAEPFGSKKDRHSYFGECVGHIGITKMIQIASLCIHHGIPMVTE